MKAMTEQIERVMNRFVDERFYQRVVKSGRRLSEVQAALAHLKDGLLAELLACDALPPAPADMQRDIEERLLERFAEQGLLQFVYSATLAGSGAPRHLRGLNKREAASLWLGLFRNQASGLVGLWTAYLELPAQDRPELPEVIRCVFGVQGEDGEDQTFLNNIDVPAPYQDTLSAMIAAVILEHVTELDATRCSLASAVNQVDVNLLRGGNTLRDAYAAAIASVIDGVVQS
jgi:hypothetical protein